MDRFVRYDLHTKLNHCGGFLFGGNVFFFYCLFFKFIQLHRPFLSCSVLLSPRQSYVPFRVQGTTRKAPFKVFLKCKHRLTSKANSFNTQYNTARNQEIPTLDPSSNDHEAATCSRTASVKIPLNFPDFPYLLHRQLSELGSIESFIVDKFVSI